MLSLDLDTKYSSFGDNFTLKTQEECSVRVSIHIFRSTFILKCVYSQYLYKTPKKNRRTHFPKFPSTIIHNFKANIYYSIKIYLHNLRLIFTIQS